MTSTLTPTPAEANAAMLSAALREAVVDEAWSQAVRAVPRHELLPSRVWIPAPGEQPGWRPVDRDRDPARWWAAAYGPGPVAVQLEDGGPHPLSAAWTTPTSSLSAPSIVLAMLYDLDVRDGHRVLEIGTGPGWTAGLLAHRLGGENVVCLEVDPRLAETAAVNLARLGLAPRILTADGTAGHPPAAPYDRIVCTAAVENIPRAWIEQARPGTVILTPWRTGAGPQALARLTVGPDRVASGRFTGGSDFMAVRAQRIAPVRHEDFAGDRFPEPYRNGSSELHPGRLFDYEHHACAFTLGLLVRDLQYSAARGTEGDGLWLYSTAGDRSVAYGYRADEARQTTVYQHGERSLWSEAEAAHAWWASAGSPRPDRFGLTVGPDGEHAWLDRADYRLPAPPA
jgi:protein-L-isoaspartate O-methyltransferase